MSAAGRRRQSSPGPGRPFLMARRRLRIRPRPRRGNSATPMAEWACRPSRPSIFLDHFILNFDVTLAGRSENAGITYPMSNFWCRLYSVSTSSESLNIACHMILPPLAMAEAGGRRHLDSSINASIRTGRGADDGLTRLDRGFAARQGLSRRRQDRRSGSGLMRR
jgi:hypothetical protein